MSGPIMLRIGCRPWAPAKDSSDLEILVGYDVPLAGLAEWGGATHLYLCLSGEMQDLSLWAYARATADDLAALEDAEFNTTQDAREWVLARLDRYPAATAIALDDQIVAWREVERGEHFTVSAKGLAEWFLETVNSSTARSASPVGLEPILA